MKEIGCLRYGAHKWGATRVPNTAIGLFPSVHEKSSPRCLRIYLSHSEVGRTRSRGNPGSTGALARSSGPGAPGRVHCLVGGELAGQMRRSCPTATTSSMPWDRCRGERCDTYPGNRVACVTNVESRTKNCTATSSRGGDHAEAHSRTTRRVI